MTFMYKELQFQKEEAQAKMMKVLDEQNIMLEKQVKERTYEIEEQKEELSEKNKEITDSINYAKRLQNALIPPVDVFKSILPDSFVLFKPKDIVSGDFYWIAELNTTLKNNKNTSLVVFSAADCTGHGVPGAFMSIIGLKIFNQSIKNPEVNSPAEALDFLSKEVYETVNKHRVGETVIRDGMDLALCSIDFKELKLTFSGAKNPVYIVRNKELMELKADKQPIGSNQNPEPFSNTEFKLKRGDMIYASTDGFPDQFGGPKGKKFKYKQFKELLTSIAENPVDEQREKLDTAFVKWKGNLEQIDDVCVIGIRI